MNIFLFGVNLERVNPVCIYASAVWDQEGFVRLSGKDSEDMAQKRGAFSETYR
jgi:hypothetical protein